MAEGLRKQWPDPFALAFLNQEVPRIPASGKACSSRQYVEAGSLMSYAVNFEDVFRRAAEYTDRILRGANPAEMPVEQPSRYELLFNLKTARALRLAIPPSLLQRADQVFE